LVEIFIPLMSRKYGESIRTFEETREIQRPDEQIGIHVIQAAGCYSPDLNPTIGSELQKICPVVIVSQ